MATNTQIITREQVIALAMNMPLEKLASWYEYGLFVLSRPTFVPATKDEITNDAELQAELAAWEAASDEDWLKLEQQMTEAS
ncbi:MAG: hypothetical protein DCC55_11240 [Chloroflexi bacterium]|nr:MAG: hypothetical protein DCC55_11240 [Chloroflexota bacterium]